MKSILSVSILFLILSGCSSSSEDTMLVTGEVKGLKKGTLYLDKMEDTLIVSRDSLLIDGDAIFSFTEEISAPEVYYLTMTFQDSSNVVKRLPFFAESGTITIHTTLENYERDAVISGSENQLIMDQYSLLMQRYKDQNLELIEENLIALKEGNDSILQAVQKKQSNLVKGSYLATVNFAKNNGDKEAAPYLMLTEAFDVQTKYLDTVYSSLTPKIKDSKYGKALESFIKDRKN
ncbi:MAG: DUF4369 domain-containing protein [Bacteroidota bacterium]